MEKDKHSQTYNSLFHFIKPNEHIIHYYKYLKNTIRKKMSSRTDISNRSSLSVNKGQWKYIVTLYGTSTMIKMRNFKGKLSKIVTKHNNSCTEEDEFESILLSKKTFCTTLLSTISASPSSKCNWQRSFYWRIYEGCRPLRNLKGWLLLMKKSISQCCLVKWSEIRCFMDERRIEASND